jgi:transposase
MSNQKYDESFKRQAVSLVEGGTSAAQVARDLGIAVNQLYSWRKQYGTTPSTHGNAASNQDEVTRLRKELARKEAELEILKKAMGIFSQPPR